jgi:hypothetical protein
MRHRASLMVVLLLSAGCAAGVGPSAPISAPPSAIPSAAESSSPVPPSPTASPTQPPTASPASSTTAACPTGSPLSVAAYVTAWEAEWEEGAACFGNREVALLGWADAPPAIELSPPGIAPSWLWFPRDYAALWDQPGCEEMEDGCPFLLVHINPESGLQWYTDGRWVLVTGHTGDPLAESCHYVYPSDWTGELSPDSDAQATCRSSFVLTSVQYASAPQ